MEKVLLVENNRTVAKLVVFKLKSELDLTVEWVNTFSDARRIIEQDKQSIFAVISGLVLPDATNGEFIDYALDQKLPLIILTSTMDFQIRKNWMDREIFDYIIIDSPEYINQVIQTVERADRNRNITALIVDDSQVSRRLHRRLLERQRFKVIEASNGKEALQLLDQDSDIRLLLTDYHMPKMDGLTLIKQIRKTFTSDQMAILVVSSETNNEIIPVFLKTGANDYIKKPFHPEEFLSRIRLNIQNLEFIERIHSLSHIDPLTGLYNRKYLNDVGEVLFAMASRGQSSLVVSMVGIDNYKHLENIYGRRTILALIRQLGKTFDRNLKRQSDVVARYDGHRFVILTDNLDETQLTGFFARLIELIQQHPFKTKEGAVELSISMGVCLHMRNTFQEMIDDAAQLLEEAFFEGEGKLFFE